MSQKTVYIIVGAVVIVGALFLMFARTSTQIPFTGATITKAVTSRSIDAKGNATGVTTTFNIKTDKVVYVVLGLKNAIKNTKLSYVRYLDGHYIDSKVAQPSKDGITNFYFAFEKGIGDYPKGTYTVKLYVDGGRAASVTYAFK